MSQIIRNEAVLGGQGGNGGNGGNITFIFTNIGNGGDGGDGGSGFGGNDRLFGGDSNNLNIWNNGDGPYVFDNGAGSHTQLSDNEFKVVLGGQGGNGGNGGNITFTFSNIGNGGGGGDGGSGFGVNDRLFSEVLLSAAPDINNVGQIVANGSFIESGVQQGFLLTPVAVPEPATLAMIAAGLTGLGLLAWRRLVPPS